MITPKQDYSKILEPNAPNPLKRIRLCEYLRFYKDLTGEEIFERSENWVPLSLKKETDVVKLDLSKLYRIFKILKREADKVDLKFATCKEGLFDFHIVDNCRGISYQENYKLGPTLFETWKIYTQNRTIPTMEDLYEKLCNDDKYLCGYKLREYPRILRKGLKVHEKILAKTLSDKEIIKGIDPAFIS